jgi:uncharacterized protein (DUF2141 family)
MPMRFLPTLVTVLLCALGTSAFAQSALEVEVVLNKPKAGGKVRVALCPGKEAYGTEVGCTVRTVDATTGTLRVSFTDAPKGDLGIKVFHDVNGNGKLDTNWMGIPTEPYGFGNSAPATFGPPSFEKAAVRFNGERTITRVTMVGG